MTTVPLPDVPCVRARLRYLQTGGTESGSRFYLSYSGSAPTGANCTTLAGDIETQWASSMAPLIPVDYTLVEVDVLDIATNTGLSGQWIGTSAGTRSGAAVPFNCATNVEYGIARRYRGGKPRMFMPPGADPDFANPGSYATAYINAVNTGIAAFFAAIAGLSIGAMGTLQHVNLSYFHLFDNHMNTSGRERAVPRYRPVALHDDVTGYSCKATVGSQRRRRTSTTP